MTELTLTKEAMAEIREIVRREVRDAAPLFRLPPINETPQGDVPMIQAKMPCQWEQGWELWCKQAKSDLIR